MRYKIVVTLLLFFPAISACGDEHRFCAEEGVCFSKKLEAGSRSLFLRGHAKFRYLYFDVYTIALYGGKGERENEDRNQALVFHYHRKVSAEKMVQGAFQNLSANPNVDVYDIQPELQRLNLHYDDVAEGDRYMLLQLEGEGLTLFKNEVRLVSINNDDFARQYLGVWLSDHPLSRKLQGDLLSSQVF
jgi:hypothetical protein